MVDVVRKFVSRFLTKKRQEMENNTDTNKFEIDVNLYEIDVKQIKENIRTIGKIQDIIIIVSRKQKIAHRYSENSIKVLIINIIIIWFLLTI